MKFTLFTSPRLRRALLVLTGVGLAFDAGAAVITGGNASISLTNSATNVSTADRFFTGTEAATFDLAALTGAPAVSVPRDPQSAMMNINGGSVTQPTGRDRQATTLDFATGGGNGAAGLSALLASWDAATPGLGAFNTPNLIGGEQVGIDGVLRFDTGGSGFLAVGDFALQYDPSATTGQGLVLTQNLSFNSTLLYLSVDESTFVSSADGFSFDASLTSEPFNGGFVGLEANAGTFSIQALTTTAVPEPSSLAVTTLALAGVFWRCRRRHDCAATFGI